PPGPPDRGPVPDRVRHRGRPAGHLQRLRLLRARLPVRGDRAARGRRAGVQVHPVLRPAQGPHGARLRARPPDAANGVGGAGAFFLLLDEPEVYGLPPDPVSTTRDLPKLWKAAGVAAGAVAAAGAARVLGGC